MKKVLIIGGGGREHALAWKCAQSKGVEKVFVAPGNAGTAQEEKCENVPIGPRDLQELLDFAKESEIDLTIVGPDDPLADGVVDLFQKAGLRIFGPTMAAAKLEWSKSFAKEFLKTNNIPTANYDVFSDIKKAEEYIKDQGVPIVIKADGLAAGKGVLVAMTIGEAVTFARECLDSKRFGDAGSSIVIEEFMIGEETSHISICSGSDYVVLPTSQDHKLSLNGDEGLQTGGMGAYSPAPIVTNEVEARIRTEIVEPILLGMKEMRIPFTGFLYIGLMINNGKPRVVEINARCGDPETQPIFMRLESDLIELIDTAIDGELSTLTVRSDSRAALGVVMTASGYPGAYKSGVIIQGLENIDSDTVKVFHAGTSQKGNGVVTAGGRVLCVTALGKTIKDAQGNAYDAVSKISWDGEHHRTDIGWRSIT